MIKSKNGISSWGTIRTFLKVGPCSETLCNVINRAYDHPMVLEEKASMPLAGGIIQYGYQCGLLWGATLGAGAQAFRLYGSGPKTEAAAIHAAQKLVDKYEAQNDTINCLDITDIDRSSSTMKMITYFLLKGGTIGCLRRAAKYADEAFKDIEAALAETVFPVPEFPVSCTAMLAKKKGLSEIQTAMVSGFAGGIGLSGGACGALGAAIWMDGLKKGESGEIKLNFSDPDLVELVERFLRRTDFEFECEKIVGRKFTGIDDHAAHLCDGGCAEIIEELAANPAAS